MRAFVAGLAALTLLTLFPLAAALAATAIGGLFGCRVEGGLHIEPCLVGSVDLGPALYQVGLLVWFFAFTWPLAILSLVLWLLLGGWYLVRQRRSVR